MSSFMAPWPLMALDPVRLWQSWTSFYFLWFQSYSDGKKRDKQTDRHKDWKTDFLKKTTLPDYWYRGHENVQLNKVLQDTTYQVGSL